MSADLPSLFSHVTVGSNDIARSQRFYDAIFTAVGGEPAMADPRGRLIYTNGEQFFIVTPPIDGQPATHANGGTIGLTMDSPEQVDAWHEAGVAAGGTSIEDPPGIRENARLKLYLAYLRDPDGNKLCATYRYG